MKRKLPVAVVLAALVVLTQTIGVRPSLRAPALNNVPSSLDYESKPRESLPLTKVAGLKFGGAVANVDVDVDLRMSHAVRIKNVGSSGYDADRSPSFSTNLKRSGQVEVQLRRRLLLNDPVTVCEEAPSHIECMRARESGAGNCKWRKTSRVCFTSAQVDITTTTSSALVCSDGEDGYTVTENAKHMAASGLIAKIDGVQNVEACAIQCTIAESDGCVFFTFRNIGSCRIFNVSQVTELDSTFTAGLRLPNCVATTSSPQNNSNATCQIIGCNTAWSTDQPCACDARCEQAEDCCGDYREICTANAGVTDTENTSITATATSSRGVLTSSTATVSAHRVATNLPTTDSPDATTDTAACIKTDQNANCESWKENGYCHDPAYHSHMKVRKYMISPIVR
jgi:hypothetical protein